MTDSAGVRSDEWPFYVSTLGCVHCGLCLPACPTYDVLGLEPDSPRGRIHLARALAEGRIDSPETIRPHLDQCIGCRACESLCPSGVDYGVILEGARDTMRERWPARGLGVRARSALLRHLLPRPRLLRFSFTALAIAERLGLRRLATAIGIVPRESSELLPRIPIAAARRSLVGDYSPTSGTDDDGSPRATVALFTGCVMEQAFGDLNRKTLTLLRVNGFRVRVIADATCCGALLAHDGQGAAAKELAVRNVSAFDREDLDFVVHNSAGCGASMRDYGRLLGTDSAERVTAKVRDVCELLAETGLRSAPARCDKRVAYDDPCHLCHGQGVVSAPRDLLAQIPGIELVEHEDASTCCGAGGIYNLSQVELASEIGSVKAKALIASRAQIVATGNPGCLMQIGMHLRRRGAEIETRHPVELLLPAPRD